MIASFADTAGMVVAIGFVLATLGVVAYALVRPFTHVHYHHPGERVFRPLD
jgi:hypothetical protein